MLQDELKLLAEWAAGFLSTNPRGDSLPATFLEERTAQYQAEFKRIKKVWTNLLFSDTKDHILKRYISFQQQVIQELADGIYKLREPNKQLHVAEDQSDTKILDLLLISLLDLKDFLEQYFPGFVNENGKIPNAVLPAARNKTAELADELHAMLQTVEIDTHLSVCISNYLNGIINTDHLFPGTYREMEYILNFTENLRTTIAFGGGRNLTHGVTEMLFYVNFNHNSFIQWYQEDLERKKALLQTEDQVALLMKHLLQLKAIPVGTTMSYDPELPAVNIQLDTWLTEYIKQVSFRSEFSNDEQTDKLELKLTVAQMALLTRLLYEEGVLLFKNIKAILKFFSLHFTSKKQERISYGSMNKLYYSADQFTAYAVRELLLRMVAKINKMHFPK